MKVPFFYASLGLALLLPGTASAGSSADWIYGRAANQQERIDAGVANGSLTDNEAARADRRHTVLENRTDRALSDGYLSPGEFRRLNREENRDSRFIFRQNHDLQTD